MRPSRRWRRETTDPQCRRVDGPDSALPSHQVVGVVTGKIEQQWLAEDPAKNQQRLDEVTLGKEPAIQGEEIYRARPLNGI